MAESEEDYWWAPKRYGIGTGPPIAWQAWAVAAAYSLVVFGSAWFILPLSPLAFSAIVLTATAALLIVCARKTRGGWRWRWGERD
jgi:hypothetical protein